MDNKTLLIFLVAVLILTDIFTFAKITGFTVKQDEIANVTRVIDGDTIEVSLNGKLEKVRFLGINTPEKNMLYYEEAKFFLSSLEGKEVRLEKDKTNKDKYDRLLRYVFQRGELINEQILRSGLGFLYTTGNGKYDSRMKKAQEYAKTNKIGIWTITSTEMCADCIIIKEIKADAEGDDCKNASGEYALLKNQCSISCNINGWQIKDEANHFYTFKITLKENKEIKLHSGTGEDTESDIYWQNTGSCPAIWSNSGDMAFLRDDTGKLVLSYSY